MSMFAYKYRSSAVEILRSSSVLARQYVSRAHPKVKRVLPLPIAIEKTIKDVQFRRKRADWSDKYHTKIAQLKGFSRKQRGRQDETIEFIVSLNLDPRKPGQSIRGGLKLPHGTGRAGKSVFVFTADEELQKKAKEMGAKQAGGDELVEQVVSGDVPATTADACLATDEMLNVLKAKGAARILGPRKIMPNPKNNTVFDSSTRLLATLQDQLAGKELTYRCAPAGYIRLPVGKASFGVQEIVDNIGVVMKELFEAKPESYGKGKQKAAKRGQTVKQPKYLLKAYVCSTQGRSEKIDLRTVDPGNAFFLTDANPLKTKSSETESEPVAA